MSMLFGGESGADYERDRRNKYTFFHAGYFLFIVSTFYQHPCI
jgi:hypothetical protein